MFKSIDTSVLDDSTGLKLLNYLARNEDNANGRRGPRSRKELFRLKSSEGIAADDFSIRQLKEKENRVSDKASSSRRTLAQDRSSLFKPNCMSTPLVPTTVHTPYLPSKKSIGVQKSPPLPPIPMSQEPEVPETPEVVPASQPVETPRVARNEAVENIYPDLENVGQQQNALPVLATPVRNSVAPVVNCEAPTTPGAGVFPETPAVQTIPQSPVNRAMAQNPVISLVPDFTPMITSPAPRVDVDVDVAVPVPPTTTTPSIGNNSRIRVVSTDSLMEIIHNGPSAAQEPLTTHPHPVAQTPKSSHRELEPMETPRSGGSHLKCTRRLTTAELPDNVFTDVEMNNEMLNTPAGAAPDPLDDSSFFVVPTSSVLKNFKLVVKDCLNTELKRKTRTRRTTSADREEEEEQVTKAPAKRPSIAKPPPPPPTTVNKLHRASQLTISEDSRRSSMVVPSSQKRRLHSTYRELTPISSPLAGTFRNEEGQYVEDVDIARPAEIAITNEVPVRGRGRPRKQATEKEVFKKPAEPKEKKKRKTTTTKSHKKKQSSDTDDSDDWAIPLHELKGTANNKKSAAASKKKPSEEEAQKDHSEEEAHIELAVESSAEVEPPSKEQGPGLATAEDDDDVVFKRPALPAPKKKKTQKRDTEKASENFSETCGESNATRRSSRPAKPIAPILPYHLINDMRDKSTSRTSNPVKYKYTFADFRSTLDKISHVKSYSKTSSVSSSKPPRSAVLKDTVNTIVEEEPVEVTETAAQKTKTQPKKSSTTGKVQKAQADVKRIAKVTKKKFPSKANDQQFDALKESFVPAIDVIQEEEPETTTPMEGQVEEETPRTHKPKGDKRRNVSKARSKSNATKDFDSVHSIQTTYRDNFSANVPRSCSTGVDSFASIQSRSMAVVSRTLEMDSLTGVADERVRLLEFNGGVMMTYPDYSKGSFVLHSKKERARVKGKPLVLNVVSGTVIVNLESEKQVARLSTFDEIAIPVGMWYSIEKIGDAEAVVMFTWK